jgi:hypothetical protein
VLAALEIPLQRVDQDIWAVRERLQTATGDEASELRERLRKLRRIRDLAEDVGSLPVCVSAA